MNHLPEFFCAANALPIIGLLCSGAVLGFVGCALLTRMDEDTAYNRGFADAWNIRAEVITKVEQELERNRLLTGKAERSTGV